MGTHVRVMDPSGWLPCSVLEGEGVLAGEGKHLDSSDTKFLETSKRFGSGQSLFAHLSGVCRDSGPLLEPIKPKVRTVPEDPSSKGPEWVSCPPAPGSRQVLSI